MIAAIAMTFSLLAAADGGLSLSAEAYGARSCSGGAIAHQFTEAHRPFGRPIWVEGDGVQPE